MKNFPMFVIIICMVISSVAFAATYEKVDNKNMRIVETKEIELTVNVDQLILMRANLVKSIKDIDAVLTEASKLDISFETKDLYVPEELNVDLDGLSPLSNIVNWDNIDVVGDTAVNWTDLEIIEKG